MPPAAATECERTGWTLDMMATVAPPSAAARAARCPARPAPMMRTSCAGMVGESIQEGWFKELRVRAAEGLTDRHSGASAPGILARLMASVRTLVVDDHADVRFLIRTIVAEAASGVEIVGEADGVESALEQLDALEPDVVIMDARMPRIDGFEAAPMLLARRPDLRILLCSAWVDDTVRRRAAEAGIRTVLSKDQFEEIPAVVLELAGRA